MNIYDLGEGGSDSNNDFIRLGIAMDAGSASTIKIYSSAGKTVLKYGTVSDYVFAVRRMSYFSEEIIDLKSSESARIGYPTGVAWVPGNDISSLSNDSKISINPTFVPLRESGTGAYLFWADPGVDTNRIEPLTAKATLSSSQYITSNTFTPTTHYDNAWNPTYQIQVNNVRSYGGDIPFIEVENNDISTTGVINLFSSSQKGAIFGLDIQRNFMSGAANPHEQSATIPKFGPVLSTASTKNATLNEWNSIFNINDGCNAGYLFESGENRDEEFILSLEAYLADNWYGGLQEHLWGDAVNDSAVDLSTREPEILKNMIFYQFYYFGASDDIRALGLKEYPAYSLVSSLTAPSSGLYYPLFDTTSIRWHFGLGARAINTDDSRNLISEIAYLPPIGDYRKIWKVVGLPPRTSYAYLVQNNLNLANFTGSLNPDGSSSPPSY